MDKIESSLYTAEQVCAVTRLPERLFQKCLNQNYIPLAKTVQAGNRRYRLFTFMDTVFIWIFTRMLENGTKPAAAGNHIWMLAEKLQDLKETEGLFPIDMNEVYAVFSENGLEPRVTRECPTREDLRKILQSRTPIFVDIGDACRNVRSYLEYEPVVEWVQNLPAIPELEREAATA